MGFSSWLGQLQTEGLLSGWNCRWANGLNQVLDDFLKICHFSVLVRQFCSPGAIRHVVVIKIIKIMLVFNTKHAYSRPSSMRMKTFLTFPRAVSSLVSWLATCGKAPPMSEPGIVMTFSAGISPTFVF
jgi:hypothetical protein